MRKFAAVLALCIFGCPAEDSGAVSAPAADHPDYGPFFLRCGAVMETFSQCVNWYGREPSDGDVRSWMGKGCGDTSSALRSACPTEGAIGTCTGGRSDPFSEDDPFTGYDDRICADDNGSLVPALRSVLVFYASGNNAMSAADREEFCDSVGGVWEGSYDPFAEQEPNDRDASMCSGRTPARTSPEPTEPAGDVCADENRPMSTCTWQVHLAEPDEIVDTGTCDTAWIQVTGREGARQLALGFGGDGSVEGTDLTGTVQLSRSGEDIDAAALEGERIAVDEEGIVPSGYAFDSLVLTYGSTGVAGTDITEEPGYRRWRCIVRNGSELYPSRLGYTVYSASLAIDDSEVVCSSGSTDYLAMSGSVEADCLGDDGPVLRNSPVRAVIRIDFQTSTP